MNFEIIKRVVISQADAHPRKRVAFVLETDEGSVTVNMVVTPPAEATLPEYQRLAARAAIAALTRIAG